MLIYLSALVALVGLVWYFIAEKPKPLEIARIMFFCGLLAFLIVTAGGRLFGIR
jgi:hypothetical protein